jgi:hypothetical protein
MKTLQGQDNNAPKSAGRAECKTRPARLHSALCDQTGTLKTTSHFANGSKMALLIGWPGEVYKPEKDKALSSTPSTDPPKKKSGKEERISFFT